MRVILDCQHLKLYPVGKPGFSGGTETMVRVLARGLAEAGHAVHVVTPDLEEDEQRGANEWWWSPSCYPTRADVVVMVGSLAGAEHYAGDALVYATNGAELPDRLTPEIAGLVAAFPVFSEVHADLLCKTNPGVLRERCVVTGLGVDLDDYAPDPVKMPGRIWVGNDPSRGLWHVLDVFDLVKNAVPDATLHVTYDVDGLFGKMKWHQNALAEMLWECKRRLATTPGVTLLGAVDRPTLVREQSEAHVHVWPSDPSNVGTQLHGLSQMDAAAAGCALVLSDVEAFPEVFGEAATIFPTIGTFVPTPEGEGYRIDAQDYADRVVELMQDAEQWADASRRARRLAERNTWEECVGNWLLLLDRIEAARTEAAE
ncbi:MAG TPA: glycosyltransferase family 4 protein [Acidimicrobiia bacterium]|nr:glycosyltransferase family 4 protein [Acidimicrobiia bacterium]